MTRRVIFLFLLVFTSCVEDPGFIVRTGFVKQISPDGVLFVGTITDHKNVTECGFQWKEKDDPYAGTHQVIAHPTGDGPFEEQVTLELKPGVTYLMRAYALHSSGSIYAHQVEFESQGGLGPKITSVDPVSGGGGAVISLFGNFSESPDRNVISVGPYPNHFYVQKTTREKLEVILPNEDNLHYTGYFKISVEVDGEVAEAPGTFRINGTLITGISPTSGASGSILTIYGEGFDATPNQSYVFFSGLGFVIPLTIQADQLTVQVPAGVVQGVVYKISLSTNNKLTVWEPGFTGNP